MINKNSEPISNENNRIKKITAILVIINALFINVAKYFEMFLLATLNFIVICYHLSFF